jgi:hypothetical protein
MIRYTKEGYFLWDIFLLNPATPIKPIPNRSMVAGSGVAVVVPFIVIASKPSINPANNIIFISPSPLCRMKFIKVEPYFKVILFVLYDANVSGGPVSYIGKITHFCEIL